MIRPVRIEGHVATIPLTQGYEAIIDAEDAPLVQGYNWTALVSRRRNGTVRTIYAVRVTREGAKRKMLLLHRVLLSVPDDLDVDHRDGNGLNNRKRGETGNLRLATQTQNACNQRMRSDNTSGMKGVSWNSKISKWQAHIRLGRSNTALGFFRCKAAAAIAYAKASQRLHGEFGRIR